MKACTLALLNGAKGQQIPDGAADLFQAGTKSTDVYKAIRTKHPALLATGAKGATMGQALARTESDLIVQVLLRLCDEKLGALPIHDALVTSASNARRVAEVMEGEALRALGCNLPVSIHRDLSASSLQVHV